MMQFYPDDFGSVFMPIAYVLLLLGVLFYFLFIIYKMGEHYFNVVLKLGQKKTLKETETTKAVDILELNNLPNVENPIEWEVPTGLVTTNWISDRLICKECKHEVQREDVFCLECGNKLRNLTTKEMYNLKRDILRNNNAI